MFKLKQPFCEKLIGNGEDLSGLAQPPILETLSDENFQNASHAKQLSLAIKLLEHEINVQETLKQNIKAPEDLGIFKKIYWHRVHGSFLKKESDTELDKLTTFVENFRYALGLLGNFNSVSAAACYYNKRADEEHAIADQWTYGGPTSQAHTRAGNHFRRKANGLNAAYVECYEQFVNYYKIVSNRWQKQFDHLK